MMKLQCPVRVLSCAFWPSQFLGDLGHSKALQLLQAFMSSLQGWGAGWEDHSCVQPCRGSTFVSGWMFPSGDDFGVCWKELVSSVAANLYKDYTVQIQHLVGSQQLNFLIGGTEKQAQDR